MKNIKSKFLFGTVLFLMIFLNISQGLAQEEFAWKEGDSHTYSASASYSSTTSDSDSKELSKSTFSLTAESTYKIVDVNTTLNLINTSTYITNIIVGGSGILEYQSFYYNGTQSFFNSATRLFSAYSTNNFGNYVMTSISTPTPSYFLLMNKTAIKAGFEDTFNSSRIVSSDYFNSSLNISVGKVLSNFESYKFMGENSASEGLKKITDETTTFTFEFEVKSGKLHYYTAPDFSTDPYIPGHFNNTYTKYAGKVTWSYNADGILQSVEIESTSEIVVDGVTVETITTSKLKNGAGGTGGGVPGFEFITVLAVLVAIPVLIKKTKKD